MDSALGKDGVEPLMERMSRQWEGIVSWIVSPLSTGTVS